jgi:hypothetical protein
MKQKARPMGRPPEFRDRVRLTVFLERTEHVAFRVQAAAAGFTASAYARQVLLTAMRKENRHAR